MPDHGDYGLCCLLVAIILFLLVVIPQIELGKVEKLSQ